MNNYIRKVAWVLIHLVLPAIKQKKVAIKYDAQGKTYLFSNLTNKIVPEEDIEWLIQTVKLK